MRSSRLAAATWSRFRSPRTISLEMSLVRSRAALNVSTSRFPSPLAQDEEELESAEEEVEPSGPVLPHGRSGPIVAADQGHRIEDLELPLERSEQPESARRVGAGPGLVPEDPGEDAAAGQHAAGVTGAAGHLPG